MPKEELYIKKKNKRKTTIISIEGDLWFFDMEMKTWKKSLVFPSDSIIVFSSYSIDIYATDYLSSFPFP